MTTILFLCTGNSCRSQMAEGFVNQLRAADFRAYSAGVEPRGLDPLAVEAMAEVGVDISAAVSKSVDDLPMHIEFDFVVTLCGHARETCPFFPSTARRIHKGFDDPPKLAEGLVDREEVLNCYRGVRDAIRAFVEGLPESLED